MVSDRYVQLTPVYKGGPTLADGADIPLEQTATPVELDRIFSSLNDLNVALGPEGANKDGALSRLLKVGADNLDGQGADINATFHDFSTAVGTLSDGKDDLFGTVRNLQVFTTALAQNDQQVRSFNQSLASVADQLAGERQELSAALQQPRPWRWARSPASFRDNRRNLSANIQGLAEVTDVLVTQRAALAEVLEAGPVALSNLQLAYNPRSGTLDTRNNAQAPDFGQVLCSVLTAIGKADKCAELEDSLAALEKGREARSPRRRLRVAGARPHPRRHPRGGAMSAHVGRAARMTATAAAAAVLLTGCQGLYDVQLPGGAATGDDVYRVVVEFRDVLDLVPQSAVKVNDVTVGAVEDIWLDGWTARVRLRIEDNVKLPDNAVAELRQTSLLGEKFVSLEAPDRRGADGSPRRQGRDPALSLRTQPRGRRGLQRAVAAAQRRRGGPAADHQPRAHPGDAGREGDIKSVIDQLDTFIGGLDDHKAEIVRALDGLDRLSANLEAQKKDLAVALDDMPQGLKVLADQRELLTQMLTALSDLGVVGTRVIKASKDDFVANLESLRADPDQAVPGRLRPAQRARDDVHLSLPAVHAEGDPRRLHQPRAPTSTRPRWSSSSPHCRRHRRARRSRSRSSRWTSCPPFPKWPLPDAVRRRRQPGRRPGAARVRPAGRRHRQPRPARADAGGVGPMITRATKVQLAVFLLISLLGVSYVSARYVGLTDQVDRRAATWSAPTSPSPAASSPTPR